MNCPLSVDATASGGWVSSWRYYVYPGGDCTRCDCRYDLPCGDPPDSNCPGLKFPSVGTYRLYVDVKEMDGSCWNLLDQDTDSKTVYAVRTTISIAYAVLNIGGPRIPATAHVDPAGPITNCRLRIGAGGTAPYVTGWSAVTGGTCLFTGGSTSWEPPVPAGGGDVNFWVEGTGATNNCFLQVMYVDPYNGWHPGGGCTPPRTSIIVAAPTNFRQTYVQDLGNGVLRFRYQWDSTSGYLADLYGYMVEERVDYPGSEDPWPWPRPWTSSSENPTILPVPATAGVAVDTHSNGSPTRPYLFSSFSATQVYRYSTYNGCWDFLMGPHSIVRSVYSEDPYWGYSLEKTGSTAVWYPLP